LAGEVEVGDWAVIGGHAAVHQWVHIGEHSMIQGGALIGQDVPPYITVTYTNQFAGINRVGLSRRGFTADQIETIHRAARILFQSGLNFVNGCEEVERQVSQSPERDRLVAFIRASKRGVSKQYTVK
jgi:UDP-N-acetylglucosamine acyltransferase